MLPRRKRLKFNQRGDTLIEVMMALSVLSMTLTGSIGVATKAFQMAQTARERTSMTLTAQSQLESVRAYRDNHAWAEFLDGSATDPSGVPGVLGAMTSDCQTFPSCFHMVGAKPVGGKMHPEIPGSYLELMTIASGSPTDRVQFKVAWGFTSPGSSAAVNVGNVVTELADLKSGDTSIAGPPGPTPILPPGPVPCHEDTSMNLVDNGDFSINPGPGPGVDPAAKFTSLLPNRGYDLYPNDPIGGFSVQLGDADYYDSAGNHIMAPSFPGDLPRVPASSNFFYSNPNRYLNGTPGPFTGTIWTQQVDGLMANTEYHFLAYFYNLALPSAPASDADPIITLSINGVKSPAATNYKLPRGMGWIRIETKFTTGPASPSSATLTVDDTAKDVVGDDFGMAQVTLFPCTP